MNDRPEYLRRGAIPRYKVNGDRPVLRPKRSGSHFDNGGKSGWVAYRADSFRSMSTNYNYVLMAFEMLRQPLLLLRMPKFLIKALGVNRAVEMIARVRVPCIVRSRNENEYLTFLATPDP